MEDAVGNPGIFNLINLLESKDTKYKIAYHNEDM
jgi:hypothetical protein